MLKLGKQSKWLAVLVLMIAATLIIGGCPSPGQLPTEQPTVSAPLPNQSPVIDSLTSEWKQVKKNTDAPIECAASDPDGDELIYSWSVDGGSITGEGSVGHWVSPDENGVYTITVTISDGRGGYDSENLKIRVACCMQKAD